MLITIITSKILSTKHKVVIVAPMRPHRGIGHALSVVKPLRAEQFFVLNNVKIFGVNGTPCDCVGLALDKLLKSKPDLIISGIDHHHNRGETIYSSGVVSAAISGTMHGVPSIALSASAEDTKSEKEFLRVARNFNKKLPNIMKMLKPDTTLNVNYPRRVLSPVLKVVGLTLKNMNTSYTREVNPFGREFYWMSSDLFDYTPKTPDYQGDIYWLNMGNVTITPLKYDLTSPEGQAVLADSGISL